MEFHLFERFPMSNTKGRHIGCVSSRISRSQRKGVRTVSIASLFITAALFPLDNLGHYLHWHFLLISRSNLIVIILMVLTFLSALFLPFPGRRSRKEDQ